MAFNPRTRSSGGRGGFGSNRSSRPQPAPRPAQRGPMAPMDAARQAVSQGQMRPTAQSGPNPAMAAARARQAVSQGQMRPSAQSGPNPAMAAARARQAAAIQQGQRLSNTAMTPQAAMTPHAAMNPGPSFSPGNVNSPGVPDRGSMDGGVSFATAPSAGPMPLPSSYSGMAKMKKGGSVKTSAKSAGKSRDGIAQRGKTKGRMC